MKKLSEFCPEIFKSRLACAFLIAQLVFSGFILDWDKTILPIENIEENVDISKSTQEISGVGTDQEIPSFSGCNPCESNAPSIVEIATALFIVISFPTAIVTSFLLVDLKNQHPHWSYERFIIIGNLAFILFNSVWWLLLGYGIERLHEHYLEIRSEPEKPFTIFSGSD